MKFIEKMNQRLWALYVCIISAILLLISGCSQQSGEKVPAIQSTILSDSNSFFYLDTAVYPKNDPNLPVGIFDSGTGGLAVLDVIIRLDQYDNQSHQFVSRGDGIRDFEEECFIYLGDQANMPYGNYAAENKIDLLREHILKDVQFLLGPKYYLSGRDSTLRQDKESVKVIVIACNTATAYGKADIENLIRQAGLGLRVIGIIDAGARAALKNISNNKSGTIGIMATAGTVKANGYPAAIEKEIRKIQINGQIATIQQAGIGLAGAIDGSPEFIDPSAKSPRTEYRGPSETNSRAKIDRTILSRYGFEWKDHQMLFDGKISQPQNIQINSVENYISYHLTSLMEKIRNSPSAGQLKSIILGCTHYPFFTDVFREKLERLYQYQEDNEYIYRPYLAGHVEFIDPAETTALELYQHLKQYRLFANRHLNESEFYISIPNYLNENVRLDSLGYFTYDYKYGREAGTGQQYVKRVPIGEETVSGEIFARLQAKIPGTYSLIEFFMKNHRH